MAADEAAAQAAADKMAADEAAALAEADKMAADEAAALAEADKMAAEAAAALAEADKIAAEAAAALAEADKIAAGSSRGSGCGRADGGGTRHGCGLVAARIAAEAAAAQAEADKIEAQEALARAEADKEALEPSAEELAKQAEAAAIKGAQAAFGVLAKIPTLDDTTTGDIDEAINRKADSTLKVSHDGMAVKFSASGPDPDSPGWKKAATNMALPIPDWASDTLTGKPTPAETGTGMVYSNIGEPSYKLFAVEHDGRTASLADAAAWSNAVIAPGSKYTGGADAGSIPGSFKSADGTFKCSGGSVQISRHGKVTASSVAQQEPLSRLPGVRGFSSPQTKMQWLNFRTAIT